MNKHFLLLFLMAFFSCSYEKFDVVPGTSYPEDVSNILVKKCATAGCHTPQSRASSGGLDFSTWDNMFAGGRNGSSIIPFSTDYSYMLYSVNTDPNRGPVLSPTMPYNQSPLSDAEYQTLRNWISNGAPDADGFVKYSDNPDRKKVYICMQGCDQVAVIDASSKNIMRYIPVGGDPNLIEAPHLIRVSPDGQYWYVVFYSGTYIQKFRASDDSLVASLDIGIGNWNTVMITPDGSTGFVNGTGTNTVKVVDLNAMTTIITLTFDFPHGGFIESTGRYYYLSSQNGNFIHKIDLNSAPFYDDVNYIVLEPGQPRSTSSSFDPHELIATPDGSKYFVSCQKTNEVRVFQTSNDSLLAIIPVGEKPQELDVSTSFPYVLVSCTEEPGTAGRKGIVNVINYNTLTVVASIYTGYQPHGIAIDDDEGIAYVANLNYDSNGPAPHHITECGGRNGYLTIIDLNTLQLYNRVFPDGYSSEYKNELLNYPYFVSLRK